MKGSIADHEYEIEADGRKVAEVSKKWFRARDTYGVQIFSRGSGPGTRAGCDGCGRLDGASGQLTGRAGTCWGRCADQCIRALSTIRATPSRPVSHSGERQPNARQCPLPCPSASRRGRAGTC